MNGHHLIKAVGIIACLSGAILMLMGNVVGERTSGIATIVGLAGIGLIARTSTETPKLMTSMAFSWPGARVGILAVIVLVGRFVIWNILNDRRSSFPLKDERTQQMRLSAQ